MVTVDHTQRAHALLSASGAGRWLNCTPSPRLEEGYEDSSSSFAAEGTLAHEFADLALQLHFKRITKRKYNAECKKLRKDELYKKEMDGYVEMYVDFCIDQYNERVLQHGDVDALIEERLDFSEWVPHGFGTGDFGVAGEGVLNVTDLKYGKGVRVFAEDNDQLKLYGLGGLQNLDLIYGDIHTVVLTIVQPRLNHIDTWEISTAELLKWANEVVRPAAEIAWEGLGEQKVGDWCRWCKAKPTCKALKDHTNETAKAVFDEALNADPYTMSDEEVLEMRSRAKTIIDFLNSVSKYVLDEAIKGKSWEGLKLVAGRANRKWADTEVVKERLLAVGHPIEEITATKLLGIGAISDLMSVDKFEHVLKDCVVKPEGKPTLVSVDDKRPALNSNADAKDVFKNVEIN